MASWPEALVAYHLMGCIISYYMMEHLMSASMAIIVVPCLLVVEYTKSNITIVSHISLRSNSYLMLFKV